MRRLRVFLLNAFLLLIQLLASPWLLTVRPAHAQYLGSGYPGSDTEGYPPYRHGTDTGYPGGGTDGNSTDGSGTGGEGDLK